MTPDTIALARRLLALGVEPFMVPPWLGTEGDGPRLAVRTAALEYISTVQREARHPTTGILWRFTDGAWLPDVGDDATRGVLLEVVEREFADDYCHVSVTVCIDTIGEDGRREGDRTYGVEVVDWCGGNHALVACYPMDDAPTSKGAALVAALEAACR